ncbi:BREX-1 system phosphatase PglZ type B [Bremerella alba]|uniref:PglZ domain-containing protein n=1 Tax=Bremerella alba TaxID=980252 RepID=A0A7V8V3M4_9BACT|nr:BREX-1 system phosphatase PglZ type B [Bremerella alba]MBA2114069.1 hypothetical protein [Bremerella alba]
MSTSQALEDPTLFDAILLSLQNAADYHRDDVVQPAAVLWPDEKREWEQLVPRLRMVLPHFLVFGPYDQTNRSGPAIWLRCVLSGRVSSVSLAEGTVPIIYLPGVSRATIRATEDCPADLKPLAELQYRGVFWSQYNGKDWTINAFLQTNHGGLELKIAKDRATTESIRRALVKLVDVPVADLESKANSGELNSTYFDSLVSDDFVDDLLSWLSDPKGTRDRWETGRWEILCSRCIADFGFDPARDGELIGAELLGRQEKNVWKTAWKRFAVAPSRYAGLAELLRKAKPSPKPGDLLGHLLVESWPQDNDAEEDRLRAALTELSSSSLDDARKSLLELEKQHGTRRKWVWAKVGHSPLAFAIQHLATLSESTEKCLAGATTADMVEVYTKGGWRTDAAMLDALASVTRPPDRDAITVAIVKVYAPWLRDSAELFQQRAKVHPLPNREVPRLADVPKGTCVLFADGLRYDVGQKFKEALETNVGKVDCHHHFSALPSVTPTAKPAVSPVASKITGSEVGEEFRPCVEEGSKPLTIDRFRKLMLDDCFQILKSDEIGDPTGRAWAEFGNLDKTGHQEGSGMAHRIPELISTLVYRVESLLEAGWQEVRIVTDHGWLLLPGGLPKTDLPKYLTATRWRRCAVVKDSSNTELSCFSWFWADQVRIACPPGIDCFMEGAEYSHGGLSLQECVVPQLSIKAGTQPTAGAKFETVKWAGLRVRIKISGPFDGCKADLRDKAADPSTSLAGEKAIGTDGTLSLIVTDESREGSATTLVLLDATGSVIDKSLVTVGG